MSNARKPGPVDAWRLDSAEIEALAQLDVLVSDARGWVDEIAAINDWMEEHSAALLDYVERARGALAHVEVLVVRSRVGDDRAETIRSLFGVARLFDALAAIEAACQPSRESWLGAEYIVALGERADDERRNH